MSLYNFYTFIKHKSADKFTKTHKQIHEHYIDTLDICNTIHEERERGRKSQLEIEKEMNTVVVIIIINDNI